MKKQAFNPFLPGYEYIPDGEPYIFNDRLYIYGSHDRVGGMMFCMNDYVCWSAPVDDLGNWKYEGIIYKKNQDPKNKLGLRLLFAPDVTKGPDGRYYLYYGIDFMGIMGVAVCNTPAGAYEFLGHIHYQDGTVWGRKKGDSFPFDPAVLLDDDGSIYLYSGFYTPVPAIVTGGKSLKFDGGYILELEPDMVTVKAPEKLLFPKEGKGSFNNHEFFEASSIRKYNDRYYFVYSSRHNHELCYAFSDKPDSGFAYGGTLISNGDLFLNNKDDENHALNYIGNNHGGMVQIKDQYYIFYHRQTNRNSYSRQACAEILNMDETGHFKQVEMTSCGLNRGPLIGNGRFEARIACNLWSQEGTGRYDSKNPKKKYQDHPYFTQDEKDGNGGQQYIANMKDGATAGYKYFQIGKTSQLTVEIRGFGKGHILVSIDEEFKVINSKIPVDINTKSVQKISSKFEVEEGRAPLYFRYVGNGTIDFYAFQMS